MSMTQQSVSTTEKSVPRLIEPGLWARSGAGERYRVAGGGSTATEIHAGDRVRLTDAEGGSTAGSACFDSDP